MLCRSLHTTTYTTIALIEDSFHRPTRVLNGNRNALSRSGRGLLTPFPITEPVLNCISRMFVVDFNLVTWTGGGWFRNTLTRWVRLLVLLAISVLVGNVVHISLLAICRVCSVDLLHILCKSS